MGLKPILKDLLHPQLSLDYFTAPSAAPPSIDDEATSATSTSVTFSALLPLLALNPHTPHNPALDGPYSAYLVACFSPHPLTRLLRDYTGAPVLNIFEASLLHARALGSVRLGQIEGSHDQSSAEIGRRGRDERRVGAGGHLSPDRRAGKPGRAPVHGEVAAP